MTLQRGHFPLQTWKLFGFQCCWKRKSLLFWKMISAFMAMNNIRTLLGVPTPTNEKEKTTTARNSWHPLIGSCWRNLNTWLDTVILTGVLFFNAELCNYSFSCWNIIAGFCCCCWLFGKSPSRASPFCIEKSEQGFFSDPFVILFETQRRKLFNLPRS